MKIIRPASVNVADALAHAKGLAKVQHPHVVTVHALDRVEDPESGGEIDCVVMELLDGSSLEQILEAGAASPSEVQRIGEAALSALTAIHAAGFVHADFHEGNVMVGREVKLIDILYRDSLSLMSTRGRKAWIRRDISAAREFAVLLLEASGDEAASVEVAKSQVYAAGNVAEVEAVFCGFWSSSKGSPPALELEEKLGLIADNGFVEGSAFAIDFLRDANQDSRRHMAISMLERDLCRDAHTDLVPLLWDSLEEQSRIESAEVVSRKLVRAVPAGNYAPTLRFLSYAGRELWNCIPPVPKLRLEKLIVEDVGRGYHDIHWGGTTKGSLGTWAGVLWPNFQKLDTLVTQLERMLLDGWYTQNYVASHFWPVLPVIVGSDNEMRRLCEAIDVAVRNDAKLVVEKVDELPADWVALVRGK